MEESHLPPGSELNPPGTKSKLYLRKPKLLLTEEEREAKRLLNKDSRLRQKERKRNSKRKADTTPGSSTSTGKPGYKAFRLSDSQSASSSSRATGSKTDAAVASAADVLGGLEVTDPGEDEIARVRSVALAKTSDTPYADKLKRIPKLNETRPPRPFMTSIFGGKDDRVPITEELFQCLYDEVMKQFMDKVMSGEAVPYKCEWSGFAPDTKCGVICCLDQESQQWLKNTVDGIAVGVGTERHVFRAWAKKEQGAGRKVTCFLHDTYKNFSGASLAALIPKLNVIPGPIEGECGLKYVREAPVKMGKGRILTFAASKPAVEWIGQQKGVVSLGFTQLTLKIEKPKDELEVDGARMEDQAEK